MNLIDMITDLENLKKQLENEGINPYNVEVYSLVDSGDYWGRMVANKLRGGDHVINLHTIQYSDDHQQYAPVGINMNGNECKPHNTNHKRVVTIGQLPDMDEFDDDDDDE